MISVEPYRSVTEPLQQAISDIVLGRLAPITEFELIRTLQQPPYELLSERALQGNLDLFQTHFLVFHCLYRLRQDWQSSGLGCLRIEPLAIQLLTLDETTPQAEEAVYSLTQADPLAAYYLDLDNLTTTGEQDVAQLLDNFWRHLVAPPAVKADQRSQALLVMDFEAMPDNLNQLKRQFRRLLHAHHPDKGGAAADMQNLQWAYQVLRQALQCGVID